VAISRIMAVALALAGWTIVAAPAHACDSNYPWLCPPVPSVDPPPDATAEPAKGAKPAKPPQVANRHGAKLVTAKAAAKSTTAKASARKIAARKAAMRRFAARARMKTAVASKPIQASAASADVGEARTNAVAVPVANPRPVVAPPRVADGSGGGTNGFASMWAERSVAAMETPSRQAQADTLAQAEAPAGQPVAAAPAPAPVAVAPQSEANEIDLAAADSPPPASDQSWVRSLFLAFGGLLAAGTALRFFI
jgi:hypothetical protein